ncbi:DUF1295 domain-containing protein [Hyphobacterium sp. HN65]|uniref:DUF1295 domain-containing protein n=1 Tax=Hyphobacterium lacteum TaxID=3116575 RepID=A0ABU7LRG2_9PROT|nr:DUF1295 domain-containing protein [Hyphobacterium sp. HN65]MEE2526510.1 DUF1295 domain-containing protein [Hyphobacterium sp. HN65]
MKAIIIAIIVAAIGLGIMALAGWGDTRVYGHSVMLGAGVLAFAINWLVFVPSAILKTEKFYDLTGSVTYLAVIGFALYSAGTVDLRGGLVAACVAIWALRLGTFLFARISADGKDKRFNEIKQNPARFFITWTLQGLWVSLTAACALMVVSTPVPQPADAFLVAGLALWLTGFAIEVVADNQKRAFRRDPENAGKFITSGLWAWSRHPNYFGEIVLWTGIAIIALPILSGPQYVVLISPVFVMLLLTRVSGVPLLEKAAEQKWGSDPDFQAYRDRTPVLFPKPPTRS